MVMLEEQTQAAPPAGTGQQKERAVQRMFSSIARYYDLNNTLLSLGLHHSWKRQAVGFLSPNDFRVLDVGAGTADLALLTAERLGNGARIVAADLNGPMLAIGSAKVQKAGLQRQVVCVQANAERLCVSDSVFDAVTTGFGMRYVLDLSQIPPGERSKAIRETAENVRPDLVCFSWRDIQIFSPHEGDASLEQAFNFYYSPNPFKKLAASLSGLKSLYQYYAGIRTNLAHVWLIRKICPDARIMIGGGAFGAFAEQLIEKLPEGTIGILGEGEEAVLKMVEGRPLDGERFIATENGKTITGAGQSYTKLDDLAVDLPYIASIFPQHIAYRDDCIGVQSKRGCPYDCAFCLYPYLEGKSVRYRPAALVVQDIAQHYRQWGTRRFWFTDAQFITGKAAYPQCTEIMERIIAERLEIEWSGYIRTSLITSELATLMVRSGVGDL